MPFSPDPLSFLNDNKSELPYWLRGLSYGQLVDIARLMDAWHSTCSVDKIVPIEEVEQREIIRAVAFFRGDVAQAARALKIGKTTVRRKLEQWGLSAENRRLLQKASALAKDARSAASSL